MNSIAVDADGCCARATTPRAVWHNVPNAAPKPRCRPGICRPRPSPTPPSGGGGASDSNAPQPADSSGYQTPYQPTPGHAPGQAPQGNQFYALQRVSGPATCLIVTAVLGLGLHLLGIVGVMLKIGMAGAFMHRNAMPEMFFTGPVATGTKRHWNHPEYCCPDRGDKNERIGKLWVCHGGIHNCLNSLHVALLPFRIALWHLGPGGSKRPDSKIFFQNLSLAVFSYQFTVFHFAFCILHSAFFHLSSLIPYLSSLFFCP